MYRVASSLFFVRSHRRVFFHYVLSLSRSLSLSDTYVKETLAFPVVITITTVSFSIIYLPLTRRTETKGKVLPSIALILFLSVSTVLVFCVIFMMTTVTTVLVVVMILLLTLPRAYKQQTCFLSGKQSY